MAATSPDKTPANLPKSVKVEKVLVDWESPARPHRKRNREYYTTIASIVFLLAVILLLLKEILLIGVILAFGFLSYVLASVPPENVAHKITTKGIRTEGKLFPWDDFVSFWIKNQWDQELIIIKTKQPFPGHIMMILEPRHRTKIIEQIGKHMPLEKPENTFVDNASSWLQKKIPLENS